METLFIFVVKSSGLIGLFYLAYFVLLRKETFFNSNRWFLLAGLITSVILPLVVFTKIVWVDPIPTNFDWSQIPMTTTMPIENEAFEINWYLVFAVVYSIGILGFLVKFVLDFHSLSKVLKGKTMQKQADFQFIDVSENIAPFSYFNSIVYNSSLYSDTELENILEHEKVHSAQNHTLDVLISRLFCVVFWFHPLMWLYKKAIVQNLEFIADSEASKNISDKKAYQLTLLKITTQENCVAITNHFYQSLIKKRIVMLNKNQSNKRNSWKYAVVLPLLGAFLFFFQVKVVAQEKAAPKQTEIKSPEIDKTSLIITKNTTDEEIKEHCQQIKKLYNIDLSYFNIKRNSNGEIINIESKFKNKTGSGSCFQSDNTPIKPFKFLYDENKKEMGYINMDLNSLSKGKEIIINGKVSSQDELDKLNPNEIKSIAVNTKTDKPTIEIDTKNTFKPVKITDKDIYIDGVKSTNEDFNKLDQSTVDKVDVNTFENTVRITTKKETSKNENKVAEIEIVIKDNSTDDEILEKCQQINDTHNLGLSFYNINRNNNGEITHIESKYEKDFSHINEKKNFIWDGKPIQPFRFWYKKYKNGLTFGGYGLTGNSISRIVDNKSINYKKAVILIDGEQSDYQTLEKINPKEVKQVVTKDINSRWPENKKYFELYGEKALYGILIAVETKNYYDKNN